MKDTQGQFNISQ